jgi:23S rRNA G2069 N7-methylase RlmK/C1962 C5-methylase RlmI
MLDADDIYYTYNYSEEFEYDLIQSCDYEIVKTFLFLNDLGGWDYYDFIEDLTTQYNRSQSLIATDGSGLTTKATTYEQMFQNSIEQSFRIKTIVKSQAEYDWLYQLVKSSRVYYIETNNTSNLIADYYQPVIITNTDFQETENTNQWVLNIEYRIAQKDISQKSI